MKNIVIAVIVLILGLGVIHLARGNTPDASSPSPTPTATGIVVVAPTPTAYVDAIVLNTTAVEQGLGTVAVTWQGDSRAILTVTEGPRGFPPMCAIYVYQKSFWAQGPIATPEFEVRVLDAPNESDPAMGMLNAATARSIDWESVTTQKLYDALNLKVMLETGC